MRILGILSACAAGAYGAASAFPEAQALPWAIVVVGGATGLLFARRPEEVDCAAVRVGERVFSVRRPYRHNAAIRAAIDAIGEDAYRAEQGFTTTRAGSSGGRRRAESRSSRGRSSASSGRRVSTRRPSGE